MKYFTLIMAATFALSLTSYAEETSKGKGEVEVETSSSHNPFTKTSTSTITKKAKRKYKTKENGSAVEEDQLKIQKKISDDGRKTSVTTEEIHKQEESK